MAPSSSDGPRGRGRPVEIDRNHLASVALDLFEQRGYHDVSAAEIATAAGISRRSLFRYFPTKADLIWDGFGTRVEALRESIARRSAEPGANPLTVLHEALVDTTLSPPPSNVTRSRLRIIGEHSDLFAFGTERLQDQSTLLRTYMIESGIAAFQARVLASALTVTTFNGYLAWAQGDGSEEPAAVVRAGLEALGLFGDRPD